MENQTSEYGLCFRLQDDSLRRQVLACAQPRLEDYFTYQNLNLAYGVWCPKQEIFITRIYYLSQSIARDGRDGDEYRFAVVTPWRAYTAYYQEKRDGGCGGLSVSALARPHLDLVKAAIAFYQDRAALSAFEQTLQEHEPGFRLRHYNSQLLDKLEQDLKVRQK